jgi:Uncharacterized protein conserved in bacteria (DUF2188)
VCGGASGNRPSMSDVYVVPSGDGWALEVDGRERDTFSTQDEAMHRGRQLAEEENGELVIYYRSGQVRETDSHGP